MVVKVESGAEGGKGARGGKGNKYYEGELMLHTCLCIYTHNTLLQQS